jgi:hypothetical protein
MPFSFNATFRAHRTFNIGREFHVPGALTPDSVVMVSLTELDSSGNPILGDATMKVYNVVPKDEVVLIRGEVDWDTDLTIRANIFIADPLS